MCVCVYVYIYIYTGSFWGNQNGPPATDNIRAPVLSSPFPIGLAGYIGVGSGESGFLDTSTGIHCVTGITDLQGLYLGHVIRGLRLRTPSIAHLKTFQNQVGLLHIVTKLKCQPTHDS